MMRAYRSGRPPDRLGEKPMARISSMRWVLCLLVAGLGTGWGGAPARDFRASDTQAEDYPTVQALMPMDRIVADETRGRHRSRGFHSRQLGEAKETTEQTRVGAIDLNRPSVAPLGSFVPQANVLALPFLSRSIDHLDRVLDGPLGAEMLASF